mgnify:CR=1 FL=1
MTPAQFRARIAAHARLGPQTIYACELVLLNGLHPAAAARTVGIHRSAVTRAIKRITHDICPKCKQALPRSAP